jgi:hypothetical protein
LKLRDLVLGRVKGLIRQYGVLDQNIGGVRGGPQGVIDHTLGVGILGPCAGLSQILKEALQKSLFVGSHGIS